MFKLLKEKIQRHIMAKFARKSITADDSELASAAVQRLMKSAPDRVSTQYRVMSDDLQIDRYFVKLKNDIYEALDSKRQSKGRVVIREAGKLPPTRSYFYLKPLNEPGWLFERSGQGWLVSRAEKIVNQGTFLRAPEPWDTIVMHEPTNQALQPRVTSSRLQADLVSFGVYEDLLFQNIGLSDR